MAWLVITIIVLGYLGHLYAHPCVPSRASRGARRRGGRRHQPGNRVPVLGDRRRQLRARRRRHRAVRLPDPPRPVDCHGIGRTRRAAAGCKSHPGAERTGHLSAAAVGDRGAAVLGRGCWRFRWATHTTAGLLCLLPQSCETLSGVAGVGVVDAEIPLPVGEDLLVQGDSVRQPSRLPVGDCKVVS